MSKGEVLYVKGINTSESDHDEEEEVDMWDDKKLNDAYDKAVIIANAEIAKRIAMSTNNRTAPACGKGKASSLLSQQDNKKKSQVKISSSKPKEADIHWKVGMPCRAIYEGDGAEYEAFLLRMINDKECVVRFLGYENSEIVSINKLKPSLGNKERAFQIQEALNDSEKRPSYNDKNPIKMDYDSDWGHSTSTADKSQKRKKSKKKYEPKMVFPSVSPNMVPNLMQFGLPDHPIPPPPLTLSSNKTSAEDQAVHSMLLSWYMTGYYTGLYQGMKNAKREED